MVFCVFLWVVVGYSLKCNQFLAFSWCLISFLAYYAESGARFQRVLECPKLCVVWISWRKQCKSPMRQWVRFPMFYATSQNVIINFVLLWSPGHFVIILLLLKSQAFSRPSFFCALVPEQDPWTVTMVPLSRRFCAQFFSSRPWQFHFNPFFRMQQQHRRFSREWRN